MVYIKYVFTRLKRFWLQSLISVLIFAALQFALASAAGSLDSLKAELAELKDTTPITVVMTNNVGRDDALNITKKQLDSFTEPDGLLTSYVKNLRVYCSLRIMGIAGADEATQKEIDDSYPRIYGINRVDADPLLGVQSSPELTFMDGYSAECFAGSEAVCVVSRELLEERGWALGDSVSYVLLSGRMDTSVTKAEVNCELKIVGTAENVPHYNAFCPFDTATECMKLSDGGEKSARALRFELADPDALDSFYDTAFAKTYVDANLFAEGASAPATKMALRVQDGLYRQALGPLIENTSTLEKLIPFLLGLAAAVGLLTGVALTKKRGHEFAVLTALGVKRGKLLLTVAAEYFVLALLGLLLGGAAGLAAFGRLPQPVYALLLAALTLAGSLVSALPMTGSGLVGGTKTNE